MIYDVNSNYFKSFLHSGKHKPTNDEVIEALEDIKTKVRATPLLCALGGLVATRAPSHAVPEALARGHGRVLENEVRLCRVRLLPRAPLEERRARARPSGAAGTRNGSSRTWTGWSSTRGWATTSRDRKGRPRLARPGAKH